MLPVDWCWVSSEQWVCQNFFIERTCLLCAKMSFDTKTMTWNTLKCFTKLKRTAEIIFSVSFSLQETHFTLFSLRFFHIYTFIYAALNIKVPVKLSVIQYASSNQGFRLILQRIYVIYIIKPKSSIKQIKVLKFEVTVMQSKQ